MSDPLQVEWDGRSLLVSDGANVLSLDLPPLADADVLTLRESDAVRSIEERGWTGRTVDVSLGRELVVLRVIDIPQVAPHEQADLVRYRVAALTTTAVDRLTLDYLNLGDSADGAAAVLAVTLPSQNERGLQRLCDACGWTLRRLVPAPTALLASLPNSDDTGESESTQLTAWLHGSELELILSRGQRLIGSHHAILPADWNGSGPLKREVSRFAVSVGTYLDTHPVDRIVLAAPEETQPLFTEACASRFPSCVPEVGDVGEPLGELPLLGLRRWSSLPEEARLDFRSPRRYAEPTDWKPWLRVGAIAAAVALVAGLWWYRSRQISTLKSQAAAMRQAADETDDQLRDVEDEDAQAVRFLSWSESRPEWIPTLRSLRGALAGDEPIYLTALRASATGQTRSLVAEGRGPDQQTIQDATSKLQRESGVSLRPREIVRDETIPIAPLKFTLDMRLTEPEAE